MHKVSDRRITVFVRNNSSEMGITAANKMRNTKAKIDRKSFYGSVFETPYLHRSLSAVSENIDHTSAFLRELTVAQKDDSVQHPYFRDISARRVFELLQVLNIHEANENFDTMEIDLLNIAASTDTPRPKIASPKQAKLIWKIRKKLEDSGVLV